MSAPTILRIRRTDTPTPQHLLLHVTPAGGRPLDLNIIGTEHENVFAETIKESAAKSLQLSGYTGDVESWKAVLRYILLHEQPENGAELPEALRGIEAVAAVKNKALTVTIRRNVEGITQRLGALNLPQDNGEMEVSPFDWVDSAVATSDTLREELHGLQASVNGQKKQVEQLNAQLEDLVRSKKEHEEELVGKFVALLNEKKLKIRDQQRLLKGATVDPKVAEAVGSSRSGKGREAKDSRDGKRKASNEEDEVSGQDDGLDEDDRAQLEETPPVSDDETATQDEDDLDGLPPPAASSSARADASAQERTGSQKAKTELPSSSAMDVDVADLPPRRQLPFASKAAPAASTPSAQANNHNDDDDETDDEL